MIETLRTQKLDQGFNENQFDKLINTGYEDIILYEIAEKKASFSANQIITEKQNKRFNKGLNTTIIAILLSFLILIVNIFITNQTNKVMATKSNTKTEINKETNSDTSKSKVRVLPTISKEERTQLNEGISPKIDKSKKLND
jgi:hypothetical protein